MTCGDILPSLWFNCPHLALFTGSSMIIGRGRKQMGIRKGTTQDNQSFLFFPERKVFSSGLLPCDFAQPICGMICPVFLKQTVWQHSLEKHHVSESLMSLQTQLTSSLAPLSGAASLPWGQCKSSKNGTASYLPVSTFTLLDINNVFPNSFLFEGAEFYFTLLFGNNYKFTGSCNIPCTQLSVVPSFIIIFQNQEFGIGTRYLYKGSRFFL